MTSVRVLDVWEEAKKIIGNADEKFIFRRITDAVELLANKGDLDPQLGTLDICTFSRVVTLPPEVETILGLNMVGYPAVARDQEFFYHINGPGSRDWGKIGSGWGEEGLKVRWEWMDLGDACTYRELPCPAQIQAYCVDAADVNAELWVYGLDQNQNIIRTQTENGTVDGYKVPVFQFISATDPNAPFFSRITAVQKSPTAGPIRVSTVGNVLLGVYQSNETLPKYRRIQLSRNVDWVRIFYRRRTFNVQSKYDIIPVNSRQAIIMMLRALKAYDDKDVAAGEAFEATAVRWVTEEQFTSNPPVAQPIQVLDQASFLEPWEHMD
jgi:hypothetical protein